MPEDSTPPSKTPRRHRPRLAELAKETTEEDLWVLDDDDSHVEPAGGNEDPAPPTAEKPAEESAAEVPKDETVPEASDPTPLPVEPDPKPPAEPEDTPAAIAPMPLPETQEPEPPTEEPTPTSPPEEPDPAEQAPPQTAAKPDRREWIVLGILGVVFLAVAIWWITSLFSSVTTTRLGEDEPDFPIAGKYLEAQSVASFWRQPIRTGDSVDVARAEVVYLPVAKVTIESDGNGVLRAIFRDDQGEFVGDTITRTFTAGHFDDSGSPCTEFPATSGFEEHSDFNAYRVGGERWTVEVLEGPAVNAPGSEFNLLFKAPISSLRR